MVNQTCPKPMKATSDGAWAGERPIDYALPLLIVQLCLIVSLSRAFAFLLKPLRQPRVIAEILGGIVLGTSCMGQIPGFTEAIFPAKSLTVLTTVANLGLLLFLFTVGLELDMRSIMKTGKPALSIAVAGITLPFGLGVGTSFVIKDVLHLTSNFGPFVVFMGVAMSITAFPVLARILAERKLLTTEVGQMAMSAAAVNDVVAWILLALAVALSSSNSQPQIVAWILLCGIAFVLVMFLVVRPFMNWMVRGVVDAEPIPEWIVAVTLMGVLISGFTTDTIGIHGIFGAFVFGLIIPKDGPFPTMIMEKIEDFTTIILLPLYFASSGLAVNFSSISGASSVGLVFLVIGTACIGKICGTLVAALLNRMSFRISLTLGVLMNTKGLVELIVLNIGLQKNVINQEIYTIMVIMALFTTFMTTPLVMLLYKPARDRLPHITTLAAGEGMGLKPTAPGAAASAGELRMLACVYGMKNLPGMLNFAEVSRGTRKRPLRVFLMHLVEFSERSSAITMVTHARKDGRPFWSREAEAEGRDHVVVAFQAYAQLSKVAVQPMTAISGFENMHEDIIITAAEKRANIIILPYHKHMTPEGLLEAGNPGFQTMIRRVLRSAPCSVAILVDRHLGGPAQVAPGSVSKRVAVLFFGGPDDREALIVARRIAEHPGVSLTVIHIRPTHEAAAALRIMQEQQAAMDSGPDAAAKISSFVVPLDKLEVDAEASHDNVALATAKERGGPKKAPQPAFVPFGGKKDGPAAAAATVTSGREAPALQTDRRDSFSSGGSEHEPAVEGSSPREGGRSQSGTMEPQQQWREVRFEVREVEDAETALLAVADEGFDLLIVGRGRRSVPLVAHMQSTAAHRTPHRTPLHLSTHHSALHLPGVVAGAWGDSTGSELGPVGEFLASADVRPSVLVVQQFDPTLVRHRGGGAAPSAVASEGVPDF